MRTPTRLFLVALLALVPAACASASGGTKGAPKASRNVILEEEIQSIQATNAYDVIRRLRPHFLQKSGPSTLGLGADDDIVVYIDDLKYGPVSMLSSISAISISRIERLSAAEATTRFGTGHPHGAIMIYTRRR